VGLTNPNPDLDPSLELLWNPDSDPDLTLQVVSDMDPDPCQIFLRILFGSSNIYFLFFIFCEIFRNICFFEVKIIFVIKSN